MSERVSGASERANGRVSGPVLLPLFLVDLAHSQVGFSCHALVMKLFSLSLLLRKLRRCQGKQQQQQRC